MSVQKDGKEHPTVMDAAKEFKVSSKTVENWINDGIIPEPPVLERGLGDIRIFPPSYMKRAKKALERRRLEKTRKSRVHEGGKKWRRDDG